MPYAGIWRRLMALSIDLALLTLVYAGFDSAGLSLGEFVEGGSTWESPEGFSISWSLERGQFVFSPVGNMVALTVAWLYFAGLERSSWQATPGKMSLLLRVTDLEGRRIGWRAATLRFFGRFISLWTMMIGYIMAAFTRRKQTLHDVMAGTVVLKRSREQQAAPV
jgi:uncharacterized RDD family membrane protein YckC